jgi:hypothetical protein
MQKDVLVSGKFVGSAVISPVGIAEKDIAGMFVEALKFGFFVCGQKPFIGEHAYHSNICKITAIWERMMERRVSAPAAFIWEVYPVCPCVSDEPLTGGAEDGTWPGTGVKTAYTQGKPCAFLAFAGNFPPMHPP